MRFLKIVAGVVAGALLAVGGGISANANKTVDQATSTFTKSTFDYIVTSPTNQQIADFEADDEAVKEVFPTYNFEITLKNAGKSWKTNLLASDKMEHYDISFFNPRRLYSGQYDENGLLVDQKLANELNAKLGDIINIGLGNRTYDLKIAAIYGEVNYQTMQRGVAMIKFTDQMKAGFARNFTSYELCFISTNDKAKCAAMLEDYLPYGELMTYDEYKEELKKKSDPGMTEEDFEAAAQSAYADYKGKWEAGEHINCVQEKSKYMAGAEDVVATTKEGAAKLSILFAILTPLLLGGALAGINFLGRRRDEAAKSSGATKAELRKHIMVFDIISACAAMVIGGAATAIICAAIGSWSVSSILIYSLPALVALAIALPVGLVYSNKVYGPINQ